MTPDLLFPDLVGHTFATQVPLPPSTATAYEYVVAANGVFLRAQNPYLAVLIPVHTFGATPLRGLQPLTPTVTLRHARLPQTLLTSTIAHARTHCNTAGQLLEVLYFFTIEPTDEGRQRFTVLKPPQSAGVTHVQHHHAPTDAATPILLELHTHGTLDAFWSGTDNRDEQGFCFYAVVGNLDRDEPTIRLRVGVYGHFWEVPLDTLFDLPEAVIHLYTSPTALEEPPYDHTDRLL